MFDSFLIKDNTIKFFFVQEISTLFLLFIFFLFSKRTLIFLLVLFIKIGIVPFHQWALLFIKSLTWHKVVLFLTVFKITPTFLRFFFVYENLSILFISFFLSSLLLIRSLSVKELFLFSSSRNRRLLLILRIFSIFFSIVYFLGYLITLFQRKRKDATVNKEQVDILVLLIFLGFPPIIVFMVKYLFIVEILTRFKRQIFFIILRFLFNVFGYLFLFLKCKTELNISVGFNNKFLLYLLLNFVLLF